MYTVQTTLGIVVPCFQNFTLQYTHNNGLCMWVT